MKILTQAEIAEKLKLHQMWLNNEEGGKRANFSNTNLSHANLRCANLSYADLRCANLSGTDLTSADLRGAGLDYTCLPLWCGSLKANFDDRLATQLLYHLLSIAKYSTNMSDELKAILLTGVLKEQANKFHRVDECGEI